MLACGNNLKIKANKDSLKGGKQSEKTIKPWYAL